jgi:hypothetical protein
MEAVIALLSVREDFAHAGGDPLGSVLDDHAKVQSLGFPLVQYIRPVLRTSGAFFISYL